MIRSINVMALAKEREAFLFFWDDDADSHDALPQTLGQFAADKDLSFTWYDAAVLSQKVRRLREEAENELMRSRHTTRDDASL